MFEINLFPDLDRLEPGHKLTDTLHPIQTAPAKEKATQCDTEAASECPGEGNASRRSRQIKDIRRFYTAIQRALRDEEQGCEKKTGKIER